MARYVYMIVLPDGLLKVGHTGDLRNRFANHRSGRGAFRLIGLCEGSRCLEAGIHAMLSPYRVPSRGRGATRAAELFDVPAEVLAEIETAFNSDVEAFLAKENRDRSFLHLWLTRSIYAAQPDERITQ